MSDQDWEKVEKLRDPELDPNMDSEEERNESNNDSCIREKHSDSPVGTGPEGEESSEK